MLFKNSKGEIKKINKLDFNNDKEYYICIKNFMNIENNNSSSHNISINNLLNKIQLLI
jgi:hypothetical protein